MSLLEREIERLRAKLAWMFRRGEISHTLSDECAQLQGFEADERDEQYDELEVMTHFGLASRPPDGAEALVVHLGGSSEEAIAIASVSRADLPGGLEKGEACLFGTLSEGGQAKAHCKKDGTLELAVATGKFVEVGGASEKLLMGETVKNAFTAFCSAVVGPPPAADVAAIVAAVATLQGTLGAWLATKGKVA